MKATHSPRVGDRIRAICNQIVAALRKNPTSFIPTLNQLMFLGVTLLGFACLGLSLLKSWFDVPTATFSQHNGWTPIESIAAGHTVVFKLLGVAALIGLVLSWLPNRSWTRTSTTIACGWLLVVLAFPYFVMLRSPDLAARAFWLQTQHDHLTWLGGDINTSMELGRTGWKSHVYIVDAPAQVAVVPLPSWAARQISLERLPQLIEWLGYTNAFCQFARDGWSKGFLGGLILLIVTLFHGGRMRLDRASFAIGLMACGVFCFALVAWSIPFAASRHIRAAAAHTVQGEHDQALHRLTKAADWLPVLRHDTYFIAQRGLLEHRLKMESPHARLFSANQTEQDGFTEQAIHEYTRLVNGDDLPIRRAATRALLREAIHTMNSGRNRQAAEKLQGVLELEPCNLKAMYILQLAYLRDGNREALMTVVDQLYATCDRFRFPTKRSLLATSQQNLMFAEARAGDAQATWERVIRSKRP